MGDINVELRHLRSFVAVAQELNFTRAAAHLHLDQPALSRQIRQLERALGVRLFHRTTRRVELTAAGVKLYDTAGTLLTELDHIFTDLRQQDRAGPAVLRLGWLISFRDQFMSRLIRSFEATTGATVALSRYDFTDPSAGLATRSVDAAMVNPPLGVSGLIFEPLFTDPRVLIIANNHPLAKRVGITVAELDTLDMLWAVPPGNDPVWQSYWALADRPGHALPSRRIEIRIYQDYLQAVAAGHVIGLSTRAAAADDYAQYGIAAVPVTDLPPASFGVAWYTDDLNPLLPPLAAAARELHRCNQTGPTPRTES